MLSQFHADWKHFFLQQPENDLDIANHIIQKKKNQIKKEEEESPFRGFDLLEIFLI